MIKKLPRTQIYAGFTLIEVTIAIFVLATSLVVLLGLQSSAMDRAVRDRQKQQAMMFARRIMATYEAGLVEAEIGERDDTVEVFLSALPREEKDVYSEELLSQFRATVRVEYADIGFVNELLKTTTIDNETLKRMLVTVYWGNSSLEQIQLAFFIPNDEYDAESYAQPQNP